MQYDRYYGISRFSTAKTLSTDVSKRKKIIERYNEAFKEENVTVLNHYDEYHASSGHLYLVRLNGKSREECNKIIIKMAKKAWLQMCIISHCLCLVHIKI